MNAILRHPKGLVLEGDWRDHLATPAPPEALQVIGEALGIANSFPVAFRISAPWPITLLSFAIALSLGAIFSFARGNTLVLAFALLALLAFLVLVGAVTGKMIFTTDETINWRHRLRFEPERILEADNLEKKSQQDTTLADGVRQMHG